MQLRTRDEALSVGPTGAALNLRVVIEGGTKWTPYLRAVELDGASHDVPDAFRKGGSQSLACAAATDEEASDNLCRAFLEANGWA
jgi:hypothetical protein